MENSISNFNLGAAMSQSSALFVRSTFDFSTLDTALWLRLRVSNCTVVLCLSNPN
jgi:hypothetical protein